MAGIASLGTPSSPSLDLAPSSGMSGQEAYGTLLDFHENVQARTATLESASAPVKGLESDLQRQLAENAPAAAGIGAAEYAAEFRKLHEPTYQKAKDASDDLSKYLDDNLPKALAAGANPEVAQSPAMMSAAELALSSIDGAHVALEAYAKGAPGDHSQLASTLQNAAGLAEIGVDQWADAVDAGPGSALSKAAGGLGVLGATIQLSVSNERLQNGQANVGTAMQAGAAGGEFALGALTIAGVTVRGANPIGLGLTAVGLVGTGVEAVEDQNRIAGHEAAVFGALKIDEAAAKAIGAANPATRDILLNADLTPKQLQAIGKAAPDALRTSPEWTRAFLEGTGLRGQPLVDLLTNVGPGASTFIGKAAQEYGLLGSPRNLTELADNLDRFQKVGTGFPLSPAEQRGVDSLRAWDAVLDTAP